MKRIYISKEQLAALMNGRLPHIEIPPHVILELFPDPVAEGEFKIGWSAHCASGGHLTCAMYNCKCPCHTPKEEKACEPTDFVLTSNPPQYKCKNCGQTWFVHTALPVCKRDALPMEEIEELKEQSVTYFSEVVEKLNELIRAMNKLMR